MEGNKVVIVSALLVSLVVVLGQIHQVEAQYCCQTIQSINIYSACLRRGGSKPFCAALAGCSRPIGNICPHGWTDDTLENTVEAKVSYTMEDAVVFKACCPNATARSLYNRCRLPPKACALNAGCKLIPGEQTCPTGWQNDILENTVNEYCKSGCVSSVCGAITTLQNSDASEVVNGAVEKCTNACSDFCTKGSITTAVETA